MRPYEEAEPEILTYGVDNVGDFIDEDLSVAVHQQRGLRSKGYRDAFLSEQEARVRRCTTISTATDKELARGRTSGAWPKEQSK